MGHPVFAEQNTWYKSTHPRNYFTAIRIVDSCSPLENKTEEWNADDGDTGSIKCYVVGTELIIAGNGSGRICTNVDATRMFGFVSASDYFQNVTEISGLEILDTSNTTNMCKMFQACVGLKKLNLRNFVTDKVTDMSYMFMTQGNNYGYMQLEEIEGIEDLGVSQVETFKNMFYECSSLKNLDLSRWKVSSNCNSLRLMFNNCFSLESVGDISDWDVSNSPDTAGAFQGCENLRELNLSKWKDAVGVTKEKMLYLTHKLQKICVGSDFSFVGSYLGDPSAEHIEGADGKWHTMHGDSFTANAMPSGVNLTYYATEAAAQSDLANLKNTFVLLDGNTAVDVSEAIREITGKYGDLKPAEWAAAIRGS